MTPDGITFFGNRKGLHIVLAVLTVGFWLLVLLALFLWRKDRKVWSLATASAIGLFVLAIGLGSGSSSGSATPSSASAAEETTAAPDPIGCLEDLGLSNVEERSSEIWRGNNDAPFYLIIVHLLPSKAEARQGVRDAVDVYAAQTGSYAVTGPLKVGVEGAGLSADEGFTAKTQVQAVAACLGG